MRHLFLHVGMHKTGTSSIQRTLHSNKILLAKHGIGYNDSLINHSALLRLAFQDERTPGASPDKRAMFRHSLIQFFKTCEQPTLVISGEGASHLSWGAAQDMLAFLRKMVDRITIVIYVRPPRSMVSSIIQQRIRVGLSIENIGHLTWPNYPRAIGKFLSMHRDCDIVLQLYTPRELANGCSVATFLNIVGAHPGLYGQIALKNENTSLSMPAVALQLAAVEALKGTTNHLLVRRRLGRLAKELRHIEGPRFRLPDPVIDHVLCGPRPRAAIAWMEERLGRSFSEFEPPVPDMPVAGTPTPTEWARSMLTSLDWDAMKALTRLLDRMLNSVSNTLNGASEDNPEEDED